MCLDGNPRLSWIRAHPNLYLRDDDDGDGKKKKKKRRSRRACVGGGDREQRFSSLLYSGYVILRANNPRPIGWRGDLKFIIRAGTRVKPGAVDNFVTAKPAGRCTPRARITRASPGRVSLGIIFFLALVNAPICRAPRVMFNKTVLPARARPSTRPPGDEMQIYRHLAKRKIKKRYDRTKKKFKKKGEGLSSSRCAAPLPRRSTARENWEGREKHNTRGREMSEKQVRVDAKVGLIMSGLDCTETGAENVYTKISRGKIEAARE